MNEKLHKKFTLLLKEAER